MPPEDEKPWLPEIEPVSESPAYPPDATPPMPPNPLLPQQPVEGGAPQDPDQGRSRLSHVGKKYFHLIEFDDQEELLFEIRKHPFGLFIILFTGVFVALSVFAASVALASSSFLTSLGFADDIGNIVVFLGFIFAVLVGIGTLIFAQLYRNNVVFVTNEKIAQILYITLFNRKISQLNIGDIQDVTVSQRGIFQHLFNFGTLVIETAGEQQNYTFTYTPKPYETSKIIINAHEGSIKKYGN